MTAAVWFLAFLTAGCAGGEAERASSAIRDSAGIQIVESNVPAWDETTAWHISPEPTVQIGVQAGDEAYQLARVGSALRLDNGTIVVMNGGSAELRYFDQTGQHLATAGGQGDGPGELGSGFVETWLWMGDSIAVWDGRNRRLTMFGPTGETDGGRAFRLPENVFPQGVAITEDRHLVTVHPVLAFRPPEGPLGHVVRDTLVFAAYASDGADPREVARVVGRELWNYRWQGRTLPGYRLPIVNPQHAIHGPHLYYTTGERHEIHVFDTHGKFVRIIRQRFPDLPLPDEAIEAVITRMAQNAPDEDARREYRAFYYDALWFEVMPAYRRLLVDRAANLWAREYVEPATQSSRWSVFDSEGRWQGTVQFPDLFEPHDIGSNYVLGVWRDELDVQYVRQYALIK